MTEAKALKDSEILSAARDLISQEKSWTKGSWCRPNQDGQMALCAEGAVRAATNTLTNGITFAALEDAAKINYSHTQTSRSRHLEAELIKTASVMWPELVGVGWMDLYDFNDAQEFMRDEDGEIMVGVDGEAVVKFITNHEDILAIFDKTITQLQEQGK